MFKYTDNEIKQILENEFHKKLDIRPIGNHELERHLVYSINGLYNSPVVIKLFCKPNRVNREIASLRLLSDSSVKVPKILSKGRLEEGTEWVITNFIEGISMQILYNEVDKYTQLKILRVMGRELGKIHSYKEFDFFGNWDKDGRSLEENSDFITVFKKRAEATINNIQNQDLPHQEILKLAILKLKNSYELLEGVRISRLCHNDFEGRNILTKKEKGEWTISAVIDFEQALPWDIDYELAYIYYRLNTQGECFWKAFLEGYNGGFDYEFKYNKKAELYLLYRGIEICSWSYKKNRDFYLMGLELIKDNL